MAIPTYADVLATKILSETKLKSEYAKLKSYNPETIGRCFAGNPILYHFQLDNLCRVKVKTGSFYDAMMDEEKKTYWWNKVNQYAPNSRPNLPALRFYEMWRRMNGATIFFRPTIAMNVYAYTKATKVLDPTAGWGGRMLGAMAMGLEYTGIDTNTDLRRAYEGLFALDPDAEATMIWDDALNVDFSVIDYDCVLTSPPYFNTEVYPHMTPYESKDFFYTQFLIPLIEKCIRHIRRNGKVCFNISPVMYKELIRRGFPECKETLPMPQQKVQGKDAGAKIYIW